MRKQGKGIVSRGETITRYIFSEAHYARNTRRVKYGAFMPRHGETSVFRITDITMAEIWRLGNHVGDISERSLKARGDLVAKEVFEEKLEIRPDTSHHPLHANIVGWPAEGGRVRLLAMNLADKARLHLTPPVSS
jgi:hypothetical protein